MKTATESRLVQKDKLLRILGVGFGVAVVIGGTIGVGILRSPGAVAAQLGSVWLIILVWLLGGVYALLGANYTAELATMLPKAGGDYVYARRGYGNYGGFVVGWSTWILNVLALGYMAIVFGEYAAALFAPNISNGVVVFSVSILVLLTALNWIGLRTGSETQKLSTFLKAIALLGFVVACFVFGGQSNFTNTEQTALPASGGYFASFVAFILAFQLVLGTYAGWNAVVFFAEEDRDPSRNIPRSLFGGVLLIIVIYLLVNLALLYVLPVPQLAASKFAAADAMRLILGERSGQILTALALLSIIGIINALLMFVPRVMFALGRDGMFLSSATTVNKGGTPVFALAFTAIPAIVLAAIGTFEKLLAISEPGQPFCQAREWIVGKGARGIVLVSLGGSGIYMKCQ
jgi:APA family basic amino acid/polyamine antiporter